MLGRLLDLFRGRPVVVHGTDQLPEGQARKLDVGDPLAGGKQVVLCRVEGRLHALDALCPHEGGRISDGPLVDGRWAMCPLHNYKFDPRTGEAQGRTCRAARVYRLREEGTRTRLWV